MAENLWQSRRDALEYLTTHCKNRAGVVEDIFETIDQCVDVLELRAATDTYARICGLTLLKARHLGVGAYSLILDGLAQEAGALLRPFIEYVELLQYFRAYPNAVEAAATNELPKAGVRAKAIAGKYQSLRDHLNAHASHSSYSAFALSHILDAPSGSFRKLQPMIPHVIDKNLKDVAVMLFLLLRAGGEVLASIEGALSIRLASKIDTVWHSLTVEFDIAPKENDAT